MTVRLYGRDVANGSLATVTRGFREALEAAGLLEGFVALDRRGGSEEDDGPPGALARDGVYTGNLNGVHLMQQGARHERHWVQVTPNSTFVPKELLGAVLRLPGPRILSCSEWGTGVITETLHEMGFVKTGFGPALEFVGNGPDRPTTRTQVYTAHHGVSGFAPSENEITRTRLDYSQGQFRVVHFSTTDGERKGTLELLKAWALWSIQGRPELAQLYLVLDHHARAALEHRMMFEDMVELPPSVFLVPRAEAGAKAMSSLLCHMHLVACPSRGEGFGLLPLQARACGVPVIATVTTGHSAGHVQGGGVLSIDQLPDLVAIDDGPAALAPAVRPEDIVASLKAAHADWLGMSQRAVFEAPAVIEEWSWLHQLAPLLEQFKS